MSVRERVVEALFVRLSKMYGGFTMKLTGTHAGMPDRLLILGGNVYFVEVKREGHKPTPLQAHTGEQIMKAGGTWLYLAGIDEVDQFFDTLKDIRKACN